MSLPEANTAWPPPELARGHRPVAESHVWWEGDLDKLATFYGAEGRTSPSGIKARTKAAYEAFHGRTRPRPDEPRRGITPRSPA
ncbi:hypothetical protein GS481_02440 [Rhodococcus hoagii]|nr:hypothetical protein [Prescottella equi]